MKTLEQTLEGVTAGGKWHVDAGQLVDGDDAYIAGGYYNPNRDTDLAYAARACSTWPVLVRALKETIRALENCDRHRGLLSGERARLDKAHIAVSEALKE